MEVYIFLATIGIGRLLEHKRVKKTFATISSLVLIIFGYLLIKKAIGEVATGSEVVQNADIISSFLTVFILTISSPMTVVFFTSLFTAKAVEYGYSKRELLLFGLGTGFATLLFMSSSVILFSFLKESIPLLLIKALNAIVGGLLIAYGGLRIGNSLIKTSKN